MGEVGIVSTVSCVSMCCHTNPGSSLFPQLPRGKTQEIWLRVSRGRSPRSEPTLPLTPRNLLSHVTFLSTNQVFSQ